MNEQGIVFFLSGVSVGAALAYVYWKVKAEPKMIALSNRLDKLECRYVVRIEDRLTLVETAVDNLEHKQNIEGV